MCRNVLNEVHKGENSRYVYIYSVLHILILIYYQLTSESRHFSPYIECWCQCSWIYFYSSPLYCQSPKWWTFCRSTNIEGFIIDPLNEPQVSVKWTQIDYNVNITKSIKYLLLGIWISSFNPVFKIVLLFLWPCNPQVGNMFSSNVSLISA